MLLSDFVQTEVSNWLLLHARVSAEPTKHFQLAMGGGAKRLGVGVQTWGKIIFWFSDIWTFSTGFITVAKREQLFRKRLLHLLTSLHCSR